MMKKLLTFIFFTILLINLISASYGFDAQVEGQNDHVNLGELEYGDSIGISLKVINNNQGTIEDWWDSLCSLSCYYKVDGKTEGSFNYLDNGGDNPDDDTKTFTIKSPEKGKDKISRTYNIEFVCDVSDVGSCEAQTLTKNRPVTVEFILNQEQREAKAFIEGVLITLNENMKDSDSKIKELETKLNSISSNVKIGSLSSQVKSIRNQHNSLKIEVEEIDRIAKQDFDYILAKEKYRQSLPTEISSNGDKTHSLKLELEEIIKIHNEMSDRINSLSEKNTETNSKLSILNKTNSIDSGVNNLINDFKLGNFDDYSQIGNRLSDYEIKLEQIYSQALEDIDKAKSTGNSILEDETGRICKKYEFCKNYGEAISVTEVCNSLKSLQGSVISENNEREKKKESEESGNSNQETEEQEDGGGFFSTIIGFFKSILAFFTGDGKTGNAISDIFSKETKTIQLSDEYKNYVNENCNFNPNEITSAEKVEKVDSNIDGVTGQGITNTEEAVGECCMAGECTECCNNNCDNPDLYPVIFVHGHSAKSWNSLDYSVNAFDDFEEKMSSEGYIPMGVLLPESDINKVNEGSWGTVKKPISVRVTYYKGVYDENGRTIGKEQDKSIGEYSQRLDDIVDLVLHHTGRDKVIIVAHSMGGLVSRNYIKNYGGDDKVYKLVTIGTPNHGIYGLLGGLCGITHIGELKECEDMQHDSSFIEQLNKGDETPGNVEYMTIAGNCDYNGEDYHDEVVRVGSVKLEGANNVVIEGECVSGGTFHQELTSNSDVYNKVMEFIR